MSRGDDGGNSGYIHAWELPKGAPPWLVSMYADIGVHEIKGKKHNPKIVDYFRDAGFPGVKDDETAWCAACINAHLERNGQPGSRSLAARSFEKWGKALDAPRLGCVVPLWRGTPTSWQGHVGLYVGETQSHVYLLGGNQGDAVAVGKYPKNRVLGYRWPRQPLEMKTNVAAAGSAASGGVGVGLNEGARALSMPDDVDLVSNPPIGVPPVVVEQMQAVQDGLHQLAPFMRWAAALAAVISIALAVYVIYRRTQDHKERGL